MALTFYDCTPAPSPRRTRILLAEKGIEVETVQIDMMKGEQLTPEYRAISPTCTIPALKLPSGAVLTENNAITLYLEDAFPDTPHMLGDTPEERGNVLNWSLRAEQEGLLAVAEAFRNSTPGMKDRATTGPNNYAQIPELAARGQARLTAFMNMMNERLNGREFLAIDQFSYADITAMVTIDFAKWVKVTPTDDHDDLKRWHAAVCARPSATA
ncbi:MAG: glutathione S-transferase [Alphaproteobacteria bacterium]